MTPGMLAGGQVPGVGGSVSVLPRYPLLGPTALSEYLLLKGPSGHKT